MQVELKHPGYLKHPNNPISVYRQRKTRSFEQFLPFVATKSLDEDTTSAFMRFLEMYFDLTKVNWEPAKCANIPETLNSAVAITQNSTSHLESFHVSVRKYQGSYSSINSQVHFWLHGTFIDHPSVFVIDPTGIPNYTSGVPDKSRIIPFFGPLELSTGFAKSVYTYSQPITDFR